MAMLKHWGRLLEMGVFWRLLWLTIRHPYTQKHLWTTPRGYEIHLVPIYDELL